MLRLIKVSGHSLEPVYRDGDFVLVSKIPILFGRIKTGDVVVLKHKAYGLMIKLVERLDIQADRIYVVGLHNDSLDSRQFGPVGKKDLAGKVVWHIRP
jgi:signal peptidase I